VLNKLLGFLISLAYRLVRGRAFSVSPDLNLWIVARGVLSKGFFPYIRGGFWRLFTDKSQGALFVGRGVRLDAIGMLRHGTSFRIGNYCSLDFLSTQGVCIGSRVTFREGVWLQITSRIDDPGVGMEIGDDVYVGPYTILGAAAKIKIGNRCQFGSHVSLIAENHSFDGMDSIHSQGVKRKGICIEDDCWFGNSSIVLDGITVGRGSVIGAGSVLTKDVPEYSVVVGNPAKIIKSRKPVV